VGYRISVEAVSLVLAVSRGAPNKTKDSFTDSDVFLDSDAFLLDVRLGAIDFPIMCPGLGGMMIR
jgi:hypothetical protein